MFCFSRPNIESSVRVNCFIYYLLLLLFFFNNFYNILKYCAGFGIKFNVVMISVFTMFLNWTYRKWGYLIAIQYSKANNHLQILIIQKKT